MAEMIRKCGEDEKEDVAEMREKMRREDVAEMREKVWRR